VALAVVDEIVDAADHVAVIDPGHWCPPGG
jgi:hypothetical protein